MKIVSLLLLLATPTMGAFTTAGLRHKTAVVRVPIAREDSALFALATCEAAKENLVKVAQRLQQDEGTFVIDAESKSELNKAVSELEAVADPPTQEDYENYFSGDWTLICATASTKSTIDNVIPKLPFLSSGPLADLRESLQSRVEVQQRIRSKDRIDHVLQYAPPDTLQDLFPTSSSISIPEALSGLNLNPLQVQKSTVSLIHKAEVQSVTPVLRTRLGLESIVLNVAGTSQVLDPSGADVLGLNLPLGEFLNAGTFDTTYMDSDLRISRGKVGLLEQLRVFKRTAPEPEEGEEDEDIMDEFEAFRELVAEEEDGVAVDENDNTTTDELGQQPDVSDLVTAEEEELKVEAVEEALKDALEEFREEAVGEAIEEAFEAQEADEIEGEAADDNAEANSTRDDEEESSDESRDEA